MNTFLCLVRLTSIFFPTENFYPSSNRQEPLIKLLGPKIDARSDRDNTTRSKSR